MINGLISAVSRFQSTLPYGSDNTGCIEVSYNMVFQSTLPYGSDVFVLLKNEVIFLFQSTLPYGSDF